MKSLTLHLLNHVRLSMLSTLEALLKFPPLPEIMNLIVLNSLKNIQTKNHRIQTILTCPTLKKSTEISKHILTVNGFTNVQISKKL